MTENDFVLPHYSFDIEEGNIAYRSPSNIALIKYWGKRKNQIPANPSISFTLDACATTTSVTYKKLNKTNEDFQFELLFEGKSKPEFKPKIQTFFKRIENYVPFLKNYSFIIETSNSFPHSSGIASSASGMSAIALCLMEMERRLNPAMDERFFKTKASFLARLGSGSACRSIEGHLVQWGKHTGIEASSDLYGIKYPYKLHKVFENYHDTILLVDKGEKQVSSTVGHDLMHGHPFAEQRFAQAHRNLDRLRSVFEDGDLTAFMELVESEALTLHGMMMTSRPNFILMKPNTLEIINRIWAFRAASKSNLCFTLDAGANVHVLYPEGEKKEIYQFIQNELVELCQKGQHICDRIGLGAKRLQ